MSLHSLAQHLQSAGRGEDKVLVHMTPGEVSGLQSLAMAHGGSLTINPETGLPEAGFLRAILPMVAGLALGPAGLGLSALNAGLLVGAAGTAATGSLGKGLMMGLGAYGGAGMGAGLQSMGTKAVTPTGVYGTPAVSSAPTSTLGGSNIFAKTGAVDITANPMANISANTSATPLAFKSAVPPVAPGMTSSITPTFDITKSMSAAGMPTGVTPSVAPPVAPSITPTVASGQTFPDVMGGYAKSAVPVTPEMTMATPAVTPPPSAFAERMSELGSGLKNSTSSLDGLKGFYSASEAAAKYSVPAGLGSLALDRYFNRDKPEPPKPHPGMIRPYTYERTQRPESYDMGAPMYAGEPGSSAEKNYFNESYTELTPYRAPGPEYAAEGGVMGYAVGGPIEQMAAMNAVGANTAYPMAGINTSLYANPMMQRPEAVNVLAPSSDAGVGAYSGEPKFAGGGATNGQRFYGGGVIQAVLPPTPSGDYKYDYDPKTMEFTQTSTPTIKPSPTDLLFNAAGKAWGQMLNQPIHQLMQQSNLNTGPATVGGIAAPAMPAQATPAQPAAAQPAYTPPAIPAYQTPEQQLGLGNFYPMMEQRLAALGAAQGYAAGGDVYNLGGYSDGGRLLKGPGDGVSDSIPAVIGQRQPARLADGEFVVPARIVSELGNGSTEAGARKLYAMMDRVQKARSKTVDKNKVAANTRSEKYLPA